MKKLFLLLSLTLIFSCFSCTKERISVSKQAEIAAPRGGNGNGHNNNANTVTNGDPVFFAYLSAQQAGATVVLTDSIDVSQQQPGMYLNWLQITRTEDTTNAQSWISIYYADYAHGGSLPTQVIDANVLSGHTYFYALNGRTNITEVEKAVTMIAVQ